jgi:hypothetical protein
VVEQIGGLMRWRFDSFAKSLPYRLAATRADGRAQRVAVQGQTVLR